MCEVIEVTGELLTTTRAGEWCQRPYPGHPHGCPNYGQRDECPPAAPAVADFIELGRPHWFIVEPFDLGGQARRMMEKHPGWSDKQARNCLYWQGGVRKRLREAIRQFERTHLGTVSTLLPEAMGVNVIRTAQKKGIPIETRPRDMVHKIALVGYPVTREAPGTGVLEHYFEV